MRLTLVVLALIAYSAAAAAQPIPVKQVEVVNHPDPQNVTGSVEVTTRG